VKPLPSDETVTSTAAPDRISVSWGVLPDEFLGSLRTDLEFEKQALSDQADIYRRTAESMQSAYVRSYGGEGASVQYGQAEGRSITLTAVAGRQPSPLIISDNMIERSASIAGAWSVGVEKQGEVLCGVRPEISEQLATVDSIDALRRKVLSAETGWLNCVINNSQGTLSVQAMVGVEGGTSAEQLAHVVAAELEEIFQNLSE